MEELSEVLREVFEACKSRDMVRPFIVATISPNGSILAIRMRGDGDVDVLTEHYEGGMFTLPVIVTVVDQVGQSVRVMVDMNGLSAFH